MHADLVLDALEQALHERPRSTGLIVHPNHGSQYVPMRCTTRLAEVGAAPFAGGVRDAVENTLAVSVIGL